MTYSLGDNVFSALHDYTGSVNDRVKQWLIDNFGYDPTMSIDDMAKRRLEALGFDGAIQDAFKKYATGIGITDLSRRDILILDNFLLDEENGYVLKTEDEQLITLES